MSVLSYKVRVKDSVSKSWWFHPSKLPRSYYGLLSQHPSGDPDNYTITLYNGRGEKLGTGWVSLTDVMFYDKPQIFSDKEYESLWV